MSRLALGYPIGYYSIHCPGWADGRHASKVISMSNRISVQVFDRASGQNCFSVG